MHRRARFIFFLGSSIACLLAAVFLIVQQLQVFKNQNTVLPAGSLIAGIPAGGLRPDEAGARVAQVFAMTPVELRINGSAVQIQPTESGQALDLVGMLAQANQQMSSQPFLQAFWAYLMQRASAPVQVDLSCSVDQDALRQRLSALLAQRYDTQPTPAWPVAGDVLLTPGQPGAVVDYESALPGISAALCSSTSRIVELSAVSTPALPPDPALLQPQLEAIVQGAAEFNGLVEVYYQDLNSGDEIDFAYTQGKPVQPGIAFTAASTIKIPVMLAAYQKVDGLSDTLRRQMELMIDLSDNSSTAEVMQTALDANLAPLQVTETARAIGLENTFLAGFFYAGAPLLQLFDTPANLRTDMSADPDIYNQTSPADMGRLLAAIQRCATDGSGPIQSALGGAVTQAECQEMLSFLARNKKGVLIENGLPEGTRMARKYGWVTDPLDGLMHSASDAALVYTPNGDFVMTIYFYHPDQLDWDAAQRLSARLAAVVSNTYILRGAGEK